MAKDNVKRKPVDAKNLEARFNKNGGADKIIYPDVVHIYKISSTSEDNVVVQFFDGKTLILEVNKKDLFNVVAQDMMTAFGSKGVSWKIPLYEYAINIDYKVEHRLVAIGDVSGIIFWLEGDALG